jgi:monoamine oxidase
VRALLGSINPFQLTLRLNVPVTEVLWSEGSVDVKTQTKEAGGETFRARLAVVTLPLGVLQARPGCPGAVCFVPELEEKAAALQQMQMGAGIRLTLRFRQCFWADEMMVTTPRVRSLRDMSVLFAPDACFPTWWTSLSAGAATLTGWAAGPYGGKLSGKGEKFIVQSALEALSILFGLEVRVLNFLLEDFRVHDWQADPYSRGCYSYTQVGGSDSVRVLAQSLKNTLFFAGEATELTGNHATVHGAIATGYRVAREILALF